VAIIPVGFGQANIRFTGSSAPFGSEITFGFEHATAGPTDPIIAAEAIADEFSPQVMPQLCNTLVLAEVYVKYGPNATGPSASAFRNILGTQTEPSVPPNLSILVRKNTTGGGRRGRGRFYIPGAPEFQINASGNLSTAYLNSVQTALDVWYLGMVNDGIAPVVLHSAGISSTPAPTPVLSLVAQALAGTQRDRMRR
jgi:hypothetical protein